MINGIIIVYFLFILLPLIGAVVIFWVFARKKIAQDRAAGILPEKKVKKPSVFRRLWNYYIHKRASVRK